MKTILGLTGGSGTGKSLAAEYLKLQGAQIIDADRIARQIVAPGKPALAEISETFDDILLADGTLNRKKLGALVFSDNDALMRLNAITHAYIAEEINTQLIESKSPLVVIDAPLLLEYDLDALCTECVCILADLSIRVNRIMARDALTQEQAENRIRAQKEDDFYKKRCRFVIENNGDAASLYTALDTMLKELLS